MTDGIAEPDTYPTDTYLPDACTSDACTTVRFSTDDVSPEDRVAVCRQNYRNSWLSLELDPVDDLFRNVVMARSLPGLHLLAGTYSPARLSRTADCLADGNDDFILFINRTGIASASGYGRRVELHENEAVLTTGDVVGTFDRHTEGASLSLRIPRTFLSSLSVDLEDTVMRHIPAHTESLRLLSIYASTVFDDFALTMPHLSNLVVNQINDLIALTLGAACSATSDRSVGAARLRAVKAYAIEHLGRRDLSIMEVAKYVGVTPRYIQKLFEIGGGTFTAFLLNQRLARAHRMLCDLQYSHLNVGQIAFHVGFGDQSYFSNSFRKCYDCAPSDVRRRGQSKPVIVASRR